MRLVVAECHERYTSAEDEVGVDVDVDVDVDGAGESERRSPADDPWKQQVPLLNVSLRGGGEGRVWAGRTVEVEKVVGRWCHFMERNAEGEFVEFVRNK